MHRALPAPESLRPPEPLQRLRDLQQFGQIHRVVGRRFVAVAVEPEGPVPDGLIPAQGHLRQLRDAQAFRHGRLRVVDARGLVGHVLRPPAPPHERLRLDDPLQDQPLLHLLPQRRRPEAVRVINQVIRQADVRQDPHRPGAALPPPRAPVGLEHRCPIRFVLLVGAGEEAPLPLQRKVFIVPGRVERVAVRHRVPVVVIQPGPEAVRQAVQNPHDRPRIPVLPGDPVDQRQGPHRPEGKGDLPLAHDAGKTGVRGVSGPPVGMPPAPVLRVSPLLLVEVERQRPAPARADQGPRLRVLLAGIGVSASLAADQVGVAIVPVDDRVLRPLLGLHPDAVRADEGVSRPGRLLRQHPLDVVIALRDHVVRDSPMPLKPSLRPVRSPDVLPSLVDLPLRQQDGMPHPDPGGEHCLLAPLHLLPERPLLLRGPVVVLPGHPPLAPRHPRHVVRLAAQSLSIRHGFSDHRFRCVDVFK